MKEHMILDIIDMNQSGQGVAKKDNMVYFVNRAVIGDLVEAEILLTKKNYKLANATRLIKASEKRKPEFSNVLDMPYGLSLQALTYENQLEFKKNLVYKTMDKLAGIEIEKKNSILSLESETRYRNKGIFPIREEGGKILIGAFERASHKIVEILDNLAMPKSYSEILSLLKTLAEKHGLSAYNEALHRGALKFIIIRSNSQGEHMIALVLNEDELKDKTKEAAFTQEFIDALESLNITVSGLLKLVNSKKTNVALGGKLSLLHGEETLYQRIQEATFKLGLNSFFQVSTEGVEKLYGEVLRLSNLKGNEELWDVYCGVGSIGIYLAKKAALKNGLENSSSKLNLKGLEYVKEAIHYANENAKLNGLEEFYFETGKAEDLLPSWVKQYSKPDMIILDPPRKGVERKALDAVIKTEVEKIIYVSCKPSTLARDLKILCENGYKCLEMTPVDLFPMSMHVETVALLSKLDSENNILA